MKLSTKLRQLREGKGYSVAQLAEESGVSPAYIRQIESEFRQNPTGEVLKKLASALGTTVPDLLGESLAITEDSLKGVPKSLRQLARKKGKQIDLRSEDIEMLQNIHFRGKRPSKMDDWELIFLFLKRILG